MATLRDVKKAAKLLGATVEYTKEFGTYELLVTAPQGMRWEEDLHQFVSTGYLPWEPDWQDMLDRMSYGCEVCDNPNCEWCHPDE